MEFLPQKFITTPELLAEFTKTNSCAAYKEWIRTLQQSIEGKSFKQTKRISEFSIFDEYFKEIQNALESTPPLSGSMRFGNIAFKDFHHKVQTINQDFTKRIAQAYGAEQSYAFELAEYLDDAYGSESRIDYGTGHELNFMVFIYALNSLKPFSTSQHPQVVHQIFYDYIFIMRRVQLQYNLEPAGSHGVWGLDDYHFLPFIYGSAELVRNPDVPTPEYSMNVEVIKNYSEEYMYLNCLSFIKTVKKNVPLSVSSPILANISAAVSWEKVSKGLLLMYSDEVLSKFPVVQHLKFGRLFPFK